MAAAQTAELRRTSCAEKLTGSMRQLRRYIDGDKPLPRVIRDKMQKVDVDREELNNSHHQYGAKASISVEDEAMREYINPKIDGAIDLMDEAEAIIDTVNSAHESKIERHEFDVSVAMIDSTVISLRAHIVKEDAVEADALYVETVLRDLQLKDEHLTKLCRKLKDLLSTEDDKEEITDIENQQHKSVQDCNSKGKLFVATIRSKVVVEVDAKASKTSQPAAWRMERTKFPTFSGNPRDFASFKGDYEAIVVPEYPNALHRTYALKENCLKGEAKELVKNINDLTKIWQRLSDRFGDNIQIVDTIIKDIQDTTISKQNSDQSFIKFVDVLDQGVQDLIAIGQEKEFGGAYTVKLIEQKLPRRVMLKWLEEEEIEDGGERFQKLLDFLRSERKKIEKIVNQRKEWDKEDEKKFRERGAEKRSRTTVNYGERGGDRGSNGGQRKDLCLLHPNGHHLTRKCDVFTKGKSINERAQIVKDLGACVLCLSITHKGSPCPWTSKWDPCGESGCTSYHSRLLHGHTIQGIVNHVQLNHSISDTSRTLLLLQNVSSERGELFVFWDSGSTISLVSNRFVKRHKLCGIKVSYDLVTLGNVIKPQETVLYDITIDDRVGSKHTIKAYGIEEICQETEQVNAKEIAKLFGNVSPVDIARRRRKVDMLIGNNYAPLHPVRSEHRGNLVLYSSEFGSGKLVGGQHEVIKGTDKLTAFTQIVARADIRNVRIHKPRNGVDFFTSEGFGVDIPPKCERCKRMQRDCKDCKFETHQLSMIEQRELQTIRDNLELDPISNKWETGYPYKVDPTVLNKDGKNNRELALKLLMRLENRLQKNPSAAEKYCEQFRDFVNRGIFREITDEEMRDYEGPVWYISHHDVYKEGSTSTPIRIVLNSSLCFNGISLNEITMKGTNTLNNLFTVQLNFRKHQVALVGDLRKMYQSIRTREPERHLRRVLWRGMKLDEEPRTYGTETVTFGDKPAACIAAVALRETAELFKHVDENAATKIKDDMYVDDIATGDASVEKVNTLKASIREILAKGGFNIKGFVMSGDSSEENLSLLGSGDTGRVLGVGWDPRSDAFTVRVRINLSKKVKGLRKEKDVSREELNNLLDCKLTRRMLLSITNSCYDPYGLLAPITIQLKIELRELYRDQNLKWDDDIPHVNKIVWRSVLKLLKDCENVKFGRCISNEKSVGAPRLILFADGSPSAMCTVAYIRWNLSDGSVAVYHVAAKTRVTPLVRMTVPKVELQAAVMAVRLCKCITESLNWKFERPIYISDSKCTLATFAKETIALNEFTGNRVAEVLNYSNASQWYHVKSSDNIADIGTRMNATVNDIGEDSDWQNAPEWLQRSIEEWPVSQEVQESDVPKEALLAKKVCFAMAEKAIIVNILKMKSYSYLLRVTARVFRCLEQRSFAHNVLTVSSIQRAEDYWLQQSMYYTREALEKGKLKSLRPTEDDKGIIVLSSRALEGFKLNYNRDRFPILMSKDPLAHVWMREVHCEEHSGVTKTLAKSRRKLWIVRGRRLAEKVRNSCYECRLLDKQMAEQQMSPLPECRLTVAPVFNVTSVDLFGPLTIRDTVKKRTHMKVWGFISTCAATRAVYIDVTESYGTDSILQTIRRFISIRGSPSQIISDQGSQLKSASKEITSLTKDWDWSSVSNWALAHKIDWKFVPAEGQHQNGLSESLIKSAKRSIQYVIGQNILSFSELQLMFFEIANVMNSRPIGTMPGSDPECPSALTPNDLILGRSSNEVSCGPFEIRPSIARRYQFIQDLIDDWWRRWYESVLPSLTPSYKWLQRHRNVQVNDICLIRYKSKVRSSYRLGRVTEVHASKDSLVRKVTLQYRLPNEKVFRTVDRVVQGIAVIVPAEEQPGL